MLKNAARFVYMRIYPYLCTVEIHKCNKQRCESFGRYDMPISWLFNIREE